MLDKNGKPYRLFTAPNPLVKEQVKLPEHELIFHNFKIKPKIVNLNFKKEEKKIEEIKQEEIKPIEMPKETPKQEFIEMPKQILKQELIEKPKEIIEEKPIEAIEEEVAEEPLIDPEIPQEGIVLVHCHPIIEKEIKDDFYGEIRIKTSFGNKFIFEAYIVESNDIEICLYTKQKNIKVGSILYPSKYKDGDRLEMLRWWKVSSIKQQEDEFLIFGQITTEIRSF